MGGGGGAGVPVGGVRTRPSTVGGRVGWRRRRRRMLVSVIVGPDKHISDANSSPHLFEKVYSIMFHDPHCYVQYIL